jgi:hypothetical protein
VIEAAWDLRNTWTWKKLRIELLYVADLVGTLISGQWSCTSPPLVQIQRFEYVMDIILKMFD